jgi:hypothetical protein
VDGTPSTDVMDEWVGIDGLGTQYLVQAGIMASMLPCNGVYIYSGNYNPDQSYICPWTFFIENGQTDPGPVPQVTVHAGNTVTVTITQLTGSTWSLAMTDSTDGQTWSTNQSYNGPQASAEWIVEAPYSSGTSQYVTLAPFSPAATFKGIGASGGNPSTLWQFDLVQGNAQVSTPSTVSPSSSFAAFAAGGFSVAYTGTTGAQASRFRRSQQTDRSAASVRTLSTPVSGRAAKGR